MTKSDTKLFPGSLHKQDFRCGALFKKNTCKSKIEGTGYLTGISKHKLLTERRFEALHLDFILIRVHIIMIPFASSALKSTVFTTFAKCHSTRSDRITIDVLILIKYNFI